MYLMTFDPDLDLIWGHPAGQQGEIITSQSTFLKCTWWPLTPILTLYEVTQLGNRAKSVQERLRILISIVAPYAAEVPTNPKITSQTTSLLW